MIHKVLPIGSVIKLKNNNNNIMICAYIKKETKINNESYDYAGCIYPYGLDEKAVLIKKDDIEKVVFIGYQNGQFQKFKKYFEGENNV